jgi:F-type H+-transporting ATPase subunit gamma
MQLVAASKMRRAQETAQATDPYTVAATELLTKLAHDGETKTNPLYEVRKVKNRLIVIITSNRGLAGAYNSNILKMYLERLKDDDTEHIKSTAIAIGNKGAQLAIRLKNDHVSGVYNELVDTPSGPSLKAITQSMVTQFMAQEIDAAEVIYTKYINSMTQEVARQPLLPAGFSETPVRDTVSQSSFEPSPQDVLQAATIRLIEAQLYQALLDAIASEHSMRMLAMKNATDNANDLVDDLTLAMNKVRQASITQELAEISGGVEAMKV